MIYDCDYFIKKFEAIPQDGMICNAQYDKLGRHCAYGWCSPDAGKLGIRLGEFKYGDQTKEGQTLYKLFNFLPQLNFVNGIPDCHNNPASINNGLYIEYQQDTPKQRILAALYDVKALEASQSPSYPDVREELAASVVIGDSADVLREVEGVKN